MAYQRSPNTLIRGVFTVTDFNNDAVTGLVQADFDAFVEQDGAVSAVAVTVSEIANGRYGYSFTPNAAGHWSLLIRNSANGKRGWFEDFGVVQTATGTGGVPVKREQGMIVPDWDQVIRRSLAEQEATEEEIAAMLTLVDD